MYRFENFLSTLEHYELVKLKQEIEKGNLDVIKEIRGNIKDLEKRHSTICTTCSNTLDHYNVNNYTIIFGPEDFRKKASFCGLDCLEYFTIKLKEMKKASRTKTANLVGDKSAEKIE